MSKIKNQILLVEGIDDKHVMFALFEKYKVNESFSVIDCKGVTNLFQQIPVRFKQSGIDTIGIILDADTDIGARWQAVKDRVNTQFDNLPNDIPNDGLVIGNGVQKLGVWIMPNNDTNGMLEDYMKFLIPDEDDLIPEVRRFTEDIESKELNRYSNIHKSKAEIHMWLALQESPGTPLGLSITKRYLDLDEGKTENLITWVNQLFN